MLLHLKLWQQAGCKSAGKSTNSDGYRPSWHVMLYQVVLTSKEWKRDADEGSEHHKNSSHDYPGEELALDPLTSAQVLNHVKHRHGIHLQEQWRLSIQCLTASIR